MNKSLCGEYDNYNYHPAEEMSLTEQMESAKEALASAMRLYQINKSDYLDKKIIEIKQKIQELESMKTD
jgi:hypothetical protein